jgi:hypothetical protein
VLAVAALLFGTASAGAAAVPCDARPTTQSADSVWVLPTGRDLRGGSPSRAGPEPGTYRGDDLTVGATFRNCSPSSIALGRSDYYRDLSLRLQRLGRAFDFRGVVDDGGLGPPARSRGRVSWGARVLTVAPGTQVTLSVTVRARRPGRFAFGTHYAQAASPQGPFQATRPGVQFGRQYLVSRGRRPIAAAIVKTCLSSDARRLARRPSRRTARPGRPRVRLRGRREVCTRRSFHGASALGWRAQPEVPQGPDTPPPPLADCLLSLDAESLALNGFLVSRSDWCAPPAPVFVQVLLETEAGDRLIGTGELSLSRRLSFSRRTSDGRYTAAVTYVGTSGVIEAGAFFRFALRCEMAFHTNCAGVPDGSPIRGLLTGTSSQLAFDVRPGAFVGNSKEYLQPWLEISMEATRDGLRGSSNRVVVGGPRARCDTIGRGQRCVWADFTPTIAFSAAQLPEIAAHIQRAQVAGQPGGRPSGRPLERLTGPQVNRNRRARCPRSLVRRYRRERPGGSCDEYPFASSAQGGSGSSVANVPQRENSSQGGQLGVFYDRERILLNDAYWVAVTP